MNPEMCRKIDAVLERVKEPASGLSMAQLGLVEKIRYVETKNKLLVFTSSIKPHHRPCCAALQGVLISGTLKHLTREFEKEFPDLSIEFV